MIVVLRARRQPVFAAHGQMDDGDASAAFVVDRQRPNTTRGFALLEAPTSLLCQTDGIVPPL